MISEIDINKHNFSKIGKYISNKLHHIHKPATAKQSFTISQPKTDRNLRPKPGEDSSSHKLRKKEHINRSQHDFSPPVGTYRVNYTAIDKNIHQYNFNRSTPHFFGQKYQANQVTPHLKEYPEGLSPKQKGFMELDRMTGREEIKGSIRKNAENPHESRFQTHRLPTLIQDSRGAVSFQRMSPRKDMLDSHRVNGAEYDCHFQIKMKRLNSHIIPFQKQTSRPELLFQQTWTSEEGVYDTDQMKPGLTRSVEWSKQLARQADGILPSYMEKTVTSRMAIMHANLKTLQMNCSDLKEKPKLQRKKIGPKNKTAVYQETSRYQ